MSMGTRIKELRKGKNLSQTELAEFLEIHLNTMSKIESDKSDISGEELKKLSDFFGVSADYLLTGKEGTNDISEEEREILSVIRDDKSMRNAMMEVAKVKKKAISYARSYSPQQEQRAVMG
jgi:transcriptional regulator with XRE-family HTH domain